MVNLCIKKQYFSGLKHIYYFLTKSTKKNITQRYNFAYLTIYYLTMQYKTLICIWILLGIYTSSINLSYGQVTIGSGEPPVSGAILQLKNQTDTPQGVNATKGLLLPRVQLIDLEKLQPMYSYADTANSPTDDDKAQHTGLVVYNVPDNAECPGVEAGVYTWNGERWMSLMPKPVLGSVRGKSGITYLTRQFGAAGEWMIENLREREYDTSETGTLSIGYNATTANKIYYYPTTSGTIPNSGSVGSDSLYFHEHPEVGLLYSRGAATNGQTTDVIATGSSLSTTSSTVQGICPTGWRIPSDYDWNELEKEIANNPQLYSNTPMGSTKWISAVGQGGDPNENWASYLGLRPADNATQGHGKSMKSCQMIVFPTGGASLKYGFNGLLTGYIGYIDNNNPTSGIVIWNLGANTRFWSSTVILSGNMLITRELSFMEPGVYRMGSYDVDLSSVRCIKAQ